jgi:uncharacterized protein (DUF1697 family)
MTTSRGHRASAGTHVALLRGVNVGGKNKLPMSELVEIFARAGAANVRTYIQSGNVVYEAGEKVSGRIADAVAAGIEERFGYEVPVVTRSASELRASAGGNPFLERGAEVETLHVAFLLRAPSRAQIASLDPARSPGDAFVVRGREIYLHLPNGVARTKLTNAYFDSKLDTTSTLRNWRTVLQLLEMAS